jgi:type II secretory pathway component GspD/PulD (secretin)
MPMPVARPSEPRSSEPRPAQLAFTPPFEAAPPRPAQPVVLPPLEEPPRVAPRARAPEPPPKPVMPPPVQPAPVDPDRFVYVVDQDLRQFLTDFSRRVGLRADVAGTVRGRLTRVKLPLEPTALLKDLEKRFDLEWLIEGEILKVASRSDLATRILALGPVSYDDLIREMRGIDIDVARYPLKRLSESNSVIVTAPASYIGRVSALIDTLRAGRSVGPELRIVRHGVSRKVDWE